MTIRLVHRDDLAADELDTLLALCSTGFEHLAPTYWDDIGPGTHLILEEDDEPVSHACVVPLELRAAGRSLHTGYVEAVCTRPDRRRAGLATRVMRAVAEHLAAEHYELGGLDTGSPDLFRSLGWEPWRGSLWVRTKDGVVRSRDEEGNVYVLRIPATPDRLRFDAPLSAPWRPEPW